MILKPPKKPKTPARSPEEYQRQLAAYIVKLNRYRRMKRLRDKREALALKLRAKDYSGE